MFALGFAFSLGLLPLVLNLAVDPYQVMTERERPTAINDLAEKTHYPLWKLAKYEAGNHDTIILGDSRARSLRDKYWHEAGVPKALNLAYGGGTIPEIYSTFKLIKNDRKIKRLVVGIQLRSFDEKHKGGMNRVPEAVDLLSSPIKYLKNWHVTKTSIDVFKAENSEVVKTANRLTQKLTLDAQAAELGSPGKTTLDKLLEPKVCFGCNLPEGLNAIPYIRTGKGRGLYHNLYRQFGTGYNGLHQLPDYYRYDLSLLSNQPFEELPKKFARQVKKNGASDWKGFSSSEKYWAWLNTMSKWAKLRNIELIFVIPPTISQMQHTIASHGLALENHQFRLRLAKLGRTIDLDFPNELTHKVNNFTDAYHFNSKVARAIVEQTILQFKEKPKFKSRKFVFELKCPKKSHRPKIHKVSSMTNPHPGKNCRLWEDKS